MALCDECGCYDDNWVDGEDITEEELEKDPASQMLIVCVKYVSTLPTSAKK